MVAIVGVLGVVFRSDCTCKVVGVADQQVGNGLISRVLHRDGVCNNLIDLGDMLVSALHNIRGRFGSCDDCRVQNLRCVTVNHHIGEVKRYALASLDTCNRVGVITVIGDAIHSHEV